MQPSDIKQLSTTIMDNLSKNDNRSISFEINENLKTGECIVETEDFVLDSTLKNQLDEIEKQLLEGINSKSQSIKKYHICLIRLMAMILSKS